MFLVRKEALQQMFFKQEELNMMYNGLVWRNKVTIGSAKLAFMDEVSEFLREIEADWKWWKPIGGNYHKQKALFELIDVIHFGLLLILYHHPLDQILVHIAEHSPIPMMYDIENSEDKHNELATAISWFTNSLDYGVLDMKLTALLNLMQVGGELIGLKDGDILQAYIMKNEVNRGRVEGGVMEGKYDKSQEKELTL